MEITKACKVKGWFEVVFTQNLFGEEPVGLVSPMDPIPADVRGWIRAGHCLHNCTINGSIGSTLYGVVVVIPASYSAACCSGGFEPCIYTKIEIRQTVYM